MFFTHMRIAHFKLFRSHFDILRYIFQALKVACFWASYLPKNPRWKLCFYKRPLYWYRCKRFNNAELAKAWWYMAVRHQMALFSIAETMPSVSGILKIYWKKQACLIYNLTFYSVCHSTKDSNQSYCKIVTIKRTKICWKKCCEKIISKNIKIYSN